MFLDLDPSPRIWASHRFKQYRNTLKSRLSYWSIILVGLSYWSIILVGLESNNRNSKIEPMKSLASLGLPLDSLSL
jgi:hypothetical protein